MKNKLRNFLKLIGLSTSAFFALATFVSCGSTSLKNEWAKSKDIVISVDPAQKELYDYVIKAFESTKSFKEGFRIKTVPKNVFQAIDGLSAIGFTDEQNPDLIYSPQDRVTTLLQSKSVIPWREEFLKKMFEKLGATTEEKSKLESFGSVPVSATKSNFYAMQHNREGILIMSSKPLDEVRTILTSPSTDSLAELVEQGKGFFRIQDFWYGNGILGGILSPEQIAKILYKNDQGKWSSGFIKENPDHAVFAQAISAAAKLWFPLWKAGYGKGYQNSPFKDKVSESDIRTLMGNDMGAVQNKVLELLESKKLDFALVGSWDIYNSIRKNINSFVNVPNVIDGKKYLQASGSWSFLFNARNNGVDPERTTALETILELIYSAEAYWEYFQNDSKVPYVKSLQDGVIIKSKEVSSAATKLLTTFATSNGFTDLKNLIDTYNKRLGAVNKTLSEAVPGTSSSWETSTDGKPLAIEAVKAAPDTPNAELLIGASDSIKTEVAKLEFGETIGLRNAIAALLGLSNIADLKGDGQSWQVGSDLIKPGSEWEKDVLQDADKQTAHMRKLEKAIFGQNGDEKSDRDALVDAINIKGAAAVLVDVIAKAKAFSAKYAKTTVSDETITKAATLYFNVITNFAAWQKIVDRYKPVLDVLKFKKADGKTETDKTNKEVKDLIDENEKGNVFNTVLNVLTSAQKITSNSGLGVFETQSKRLDNTNPQFSPVWGLWNDQVFGNAVFMNELASKNISTLEEFIAELINKFDTLYKTRVQGLDATPGISDKITI